MKVTPAKPTQVHLRLLSVLLLSITLCLSGCKKSNDGPSAATKTAGPKTPVNFLVSADTAGWIVPCGCTTKQSGGLLRRGSLVKNLGQTHQTIVLDVGGAAAGKSDYHRVKLESILQGEIAMGLSAHNIGRSEAAFGADVLKEIDRSHKQPLLSTNITDAQGNHVASTHRIIETNGNRFAVLGVIDSKLGGDELKVLDPQQAILNVLGNLEQTPDAIIVLAYLPRAALFELAKQLPEVDVILGGPTGQSIAPTKVGSVLVASSTNKGKFVVRMTYQPDAKPRWDAEVVEVDDTLQDDSEQVSNLEHYHQLLAIRDFESQTTGLKTATLLATRSNDHFVGNRACQKCHATDCEHYSSTQHAIAWKTLRDKSSHVDPYCQQCHTTGYAAANGFVSRAKSANLFNVGCESCHGPSSRHAENFKTKTVYDAKDQCIHCHDRENSPLFQYQDYWNKIKHGGKVIVNQSEAK